MAYNPNCDGAGPHYGHSVRRLPYDGSGGALLLCLGCYRREIEFRRERNEELAPDCRFDLPQWSALKVYRSE